MKTDSFVFYASYYEAIKTLKEEEQLPLLIAICEYALNHKETNLGGAAKGMMSLIKPQLDANFQRRINGNKGGRPMKDNDAQSGGEPEDKADRKSKNHRLSEEKTIGYENEKPNVNVNVNGNVNGNVLRESTKEKKRFVKPTLTDIISYCQERNNSVDPERFFNYYESNGWKVGKNSMKDWKAAVRTWEKSSYQKRDELPVYDTSSNPMMDKEEEKELLALMGKA